jgi:hypothetical protein
MADKPKSSTSIPASVQAKMQQGVRQRYALATTPAASKIGDAKK